MLLKDICIIKNMDIILHPIRYIKNYINELSFRKKFMDACKKNNDEIKNYIDYVDEYDLAIGLHTLMDNILTNDTDISIFINNKNFNINNFLVVCENEKIDKFIKLCNNNGIKIQNYDASEAFEDSYYENNINKCLTIYKNFKVNVHINDNSCMRSAMYNSRSIEKVILLYLLDPKYYNEKFPYFNTIGKWDDL